jgi:succinoglycan biosynthesis protein ExoA
VFDPAISSVYRPRESLGAIARQYWRYGRWKAVMLAREPTSLRPRQLAPPVLLATAAAAALPSRWSPSARALIAGYGLALGAESARARAGWRVPVVLTTMHLLWGAGLLSGFVRPPDRDLAGRAP